MGNNLFLNASLATLHSLEHGASGYARLGRGLCRLLLCDGRLVRVSVIGQDIAPRFECFTLAIEAEAVAPTEPTIDFEAIERGAAISVLMREEYIEPSRGNPSDLLGAPPHMTQKAARPGHVPKDALASCLVAYGLSIESMNKNLVIAADWAPLAMEINTNQGRIDELLHSSEVIPLSVYVERFT